MRLPLLILSFLVPLGLAFHSVAAGSSAPIFPPRIGGLELSNQTDFEKDSPGLGMGWSYHTEGIKADVYLYNGRLATIPDDLSSPIVAGHFQEVVAEIYAMKSQGYYTDIRTVTPEERVNIGSMSFLHAELKFTQENIPRVSHVYLTVWKNQFLKIRFTFFASEQKAGTKALAEFVPAIVRVFESAK
jgi:hypothetical protein